MRALAILSVGALGLALAVPALAQDDPHYADSSNYSGQGEEVEVIAPRHSLQPGEHVGVPAEVKFSQLVAYDDLNLRSARGARILRARIRETAHDICTDLDYAYPGTGDDHHACYDKATRGAMAQADAAIEHASGYAY